MPVFRQKLYKKKEVNILKKNTIKLSLFIAAFAFIGIIVVMPTAAAGANTDDIAVSYTNDAVHELSIAPGTAVLEVTSYPDAGGTEGSDTDTSNSYSVTTNAGGTAKITGALNTNMPGSMVLAATLTSTGGTPSGSDITLSTAAADLVGSIANGVSTGDITLTYTANVSDNRVIAGARTLTLTISDS